MVHKLSLNLDTLYNLKLRFEYKLRILFDQIFIVVIYI